MIPIHRTTAFVKWPAYNCVKVFNSFISHQTRELIRVRVEKIFIRQVNLYLTRLFHLSIYFLLLTVCFFRKIIFVRVCIFNMPCLIYMFSNEYLTLLSFYVWKLSKAYEKVYLIFYNYFLRVCRNFHTLTRAYVTPSRKYRFFRIYVYLIMIFIT